MAKAAKGATYAKALDEARLRGDWTSADQPSGTGKAIPWSELIRKFAKHNPQDASNASIITLEQQIRSSLTHFYQQADFNDASYLGDTADAKGKISTVAPPALPLNKSGDGWSGETIANAIRELNDARKSAGDTQVRLTITALQAYCYYAIGQDENAVELLHEAKYLEDVDVPAIKQGNFSREGREYMIALFMMGFTVYGLANERLMKSRGDDGYAPFALAGYTSAIDIHEGIRGGQSAKALRGLPEDEIERWAETALYHNALFSVRFTNTAIALNALRAYQANAGRWTSTFRNPQRMVIYRTYLAELNKSVEDNTYALPPQGAVATTDDCRSIAYQSSVISASASRVEIRDFESERTLRTGAGREAANASLRIASRTMSKRRPAPYRTVRPPEAYWNNETLTVQKAAAEAMSRTSQFPRAGKVNKAALDLADELIKGWRYSGERGGFDADELVDLLYTLMRFTFHSQRITRHLFTILVAAENYEEARRALKLYVQIVQKAREGDAADAATLVSESKIREKQDEAEGKTAEDKAREDKEEEEKDEAEKAPKRIEVSEEAKASAKEIHIDSDSDEMYINTLLLGAHVYCRYLDDARGAKGLVDKVSELLEGESGKKLASNTFIMAKCKRVIGATLASYCRAVNLPSKRIAMQSEALSQLKQAVQLDDQSSEAFFQLAQLQCEMMEVKFAIRTARRAVELEPANVEYWHLLTLLVSADQDARGALRVAEEGLAEAEDDNQGASRGPLSGGANNVRTEAPGSKKGSARTALLSMDFPPTQRERDESIVQLLVTHNALEEVVEGCVAAINAQREIFEFYHSHIAIWEHVPRTMAASASTTNGVNGGLGNGVPGQGRGSLQGRDDTYSTHMRDAGTLHTRFHSLTGLGHSGSSHHLFGRHFHHHDGRYNGAIETAKGPSKGIAAPPHVRDDQDESDNITPTYAQVRDRRRHAQEAALLGSLWLMAAASFRRNGEQADCRVAIQEAERIDPGMADVWLQLGLWFERQPAKHGAEHPIGLAIQSLYKALACQPEHVGATVHLARLFVTHPLNPHIKDGAQPIVSSTMHEVASPLPSTSDNIQASPLASELLAQTQSRRISASATPQQHPSPAKKTTAEAAAALQVASRSAAEERKRLATLSMAEGLLESLTQNAGWSSPEAWLYLAKVLQQTARPERQRECLQYALELERAKPIRALSAALRSAC